MGPYRDARGNHLDEDTMWQTLDRALSCAFNDPGYAYVIASCVWDDAQFYGYREIADASSALLSILADDA